MDYYIVDNNDCDTGKVFISLSSWQNYFCGENYLNDNFFQAINWCKMEKIKLFIDVVFSQISYEDIYNGRFKYHYGQLYIVSGQQTVKRRRGNDFTIPVLKILETVKWDDIKSEFPDVDKGDERLKMRNYICKKLFIWLANKFGCKDVVDKSFFEIKKWKYEILKFISSGHRTDELIGISVRANKFNDFPPKDEIEKFLSNLKCLRSDIDENGTHTWTEKFE